MITACRVLFQMIEYQYDAANVRLLNLRQPDGVQRSAIGIDELCWNEIGKSRRLIVQAVCVLEVGAHIRNLRCKKLAIPNDQFGNLPLCAPSFDLCVSDGTAARVGAPHQHFRTRKRRPGCSCLRSERFLARQCCAHRLSTCLC